MSQTMQPPGQPPVAVPPGAQPNPAFQQWMQAFQQQQAVVQENARKQAQFDAACKLIRDDGVKGFRLDIEADSTVAPDEQQEQAQRTMFIREITPFLQNAAPIAQGNPKMAKLVAELGMFVIRGYRVARTVEEAFEEAFEVLGQMPPPPPKGGQGGSRVDPQLEQAKLMAQVHDTQTKAQTDQAVAASKAQTDQMAIAQKAQQANMTLQAARERAAQEDDNNIARLMLERQKMELQHQQHQDSLAAQSARGMD